MNTITNIALASLLTLTAGSASAVTIFSDDFNRVDNNTVGNGWSELASGNGDVKIDGNQLRLRDNLAGSPDAAAATGVIDATGYENINVSFTWQARNRNEASDFLRLSYGLDPAPAMTDEAAWTQIFSGSDAGTNVFTASIALDALVENSLFSLMFWTEVSGNNSGNDEGFMIDSVVVTGDLIPVVPLPAGGLLMLSGLAGFAALRRRK